MRRIKTTGRKILSAILTAAMVACLLPQLPASKVEAAFSGALTTVDSAKANDNVVTVSFNDGAVKGKITFLEDGIFRYNVDPTGDFSEYAAINNAADTAKIVQYPDSSDEYTHPEASVAKDGDYIVITSGNTKIKFEKATAKMTVEYNGNVVLQEKSALSVGSKTTQTLVKNSGENFYGGGTQNGRFVHTGEVINIKNESNWVDGGVASPNPFYYTTEGYGVLRNTFLPGSYDFGNTESGTVTAVHDENEFDAYYFLSGGSNAAKIVQDILAGYFHVTGSPVLLPEYAFYEGHLNAYNRDSWSDSSGSKNWAIKGSNASDGSEGNETAYYESGMSTGYVLPEGAASESLNGSAEVHTTALDNYPANVTTPDKYSARAVIEQYEKFDMPLGYFLPNDGYGAGYGQNGYYVTGGVNSDGSSSEARLAAVKANVDNLAAFTSYARSKGIEVGLWTQSNLTPVSDSTMPWHLLRDFRQEVTTGGVTTLKTDVAWVGPGYNFALNGTKTAYDIVTTEVSYRPNIITLDGWAGTQRFGAIWTGDQYGGEWEYIRFHIPTYIGQSLSGNPNIGSDMDGIFGGDKIISTRDTQWKIFTPEMLNMDGWGSYAKTPQTFGDPYTGINRMYLKLKAQLMPYIYTNAASAANIDTGNDDTGLPMVRAMFLEYPDDTYAASKAMQYQFIFGENILVAPVYTETDAINSLGDDVRNGIYLPDEDEIWIDYFTGEQYTGGQTLNNFDVPIWKLPVFVKNGAIIPMWEENNNPTQIDKTNRIVEFWPEGTTDYTAYEDDGTYVQNTTEEVDGYGTVADISYGDHVSTKYTSKVDGTTATLTAEKSTGSYDGYDKNKNTTFVVNVSTEPTAVTAKNGSAELEIVKVDSKEAFESTEAAAGKAVYYYDAAPEIETYALEAENEFIAMMEGKVSSPKLYVKFAETDSQANVQTLTLNGFENVDPDLAVNALNPDLAVPTGLADSEELKTPTSNTLTWNAVEGATSYEILVDGVVNTVGNATTFTHSDQVYNSTHTYKVRARNAAGYSEWSEELEATTALDPWRNVPAPETITWTGGDVWGDLSYATDHDTGTMFHSTGDVVTDSVPMIFDYGNAYELDKLEYYPRDNYGNGTVYQMDVYTSLDGVHWTKHSGDTWSYDSSKTVEENVKTIDLTGEGARYVKMIVNNSAGNYFASNEIAVYKKDGTKAFAVGSTNGLANVSDGDYTNMKNYLGMSAADGETYEKQIAERFGDVNNNDVYDVYDYAFTMFKLDGGTEKTEDVSGTILLIPSAETVEAGETFTIDVYADNVKNLNAFGQVLDYDQTKVEYVGISADLDIAQMENLTVNKVYADSAYLNVAFANRGNQELYSGTGVIATITMKATAAGNVADAIDLSSMMLIGPEYDFIECESTVTPETPDLVTGDSANYVYGEDFTVTMTNEYLTTDDGTNVNKLIQQNSYDGLFNGTKDPSTAPRDFEFKWDIESNYVTGDSLPEEISLPVTLHLDLNEDKAVSSVKVYNANKGNGYVTGAEATYYYSDGSSEAVAEITADGSDYFAFEFTNPNAEKAVASVDVTIKSASAGTNAVTNMLTLAEIEVNSVVESEINDVTVTMTNDILTEDDGTNVTKLIQQNSYDGLFNGTVIGDRGFEFLWDYEGNHHPETGALPEYVALPVTLHMAIDEADVNAVKLYNANNGNGYVTKAGATYYYSDGSSADADDITADGSDYFAFEFTNPNADKKVTAIDLNIKEAGSATNMLTLAEIDILSTASAGSLGKDDMSVTMTNEYLTTDDGSNVSKLIQQSSYDNLFNGTITGDRGFEFKWNIESNYEKVFPEYITLPATLHMNMDEAKVLDTVTVYNANEGNGYVKKATAVFNYEDGSASDPVVIDEARLDYAFNNPATDKKVVSVDVTINESTTGNKNLTLAEIELSYSSSVAAVESIAPAEDNEKEIYVNNMADINAVFEPENVSNPYFTATSSDESVARIVTLEDEETGLPIYKVYGLKAGKTTITLTAVENSEITAEYEVTVLAGADKTELIALITECSSINKDFYTEESYAGLEAAIADANVVKADEDATESEVKQAIKKLKAAVEALEETPVTEITDTSDFTADAESIYAGPEKLINDDETDYWESPYYNDPDGTFTVGLPKDIVFDLGDEYDLEKVEIVKNAAANGKVTKYEVLVSVDDGETYTSVGTKETPAKELKSGIRFEQDGVTHVIVRIHEATNSDGSAGANYARLAEVNFYGKKVVDKEALKNLVATNESKEQGNYTDDSWKEFTEALAEAKEVLESDEAAQEDVDAALETLQAAIDGLEVKEPEDDDDDEKPGNPDDDEDDTDPSVDKSALERVVKANEGKDEDDYTESSWKAFEKALKNAKAVLNSSDATQKEVNSALKALESASAGLKKQSADDKTSSGGDSKDSDKGSTNSGSSNSGNSSTGGTASSTTSAATGDSSMTMLYVVLIAAAVILVVARKKLKK